MIDGSIIHSAPYLSAKAPTIGPQKNVGAAAATEETAVNYAGKHRCSRTYDRQARQNRHFYSKHFGRAKSICPYNVSLKSRIKRDSYSRRFEGSNNHAK